jgi:hypothetical protein
MPKRSANVDGKVTPVPVRQFVLYDLGQGFLGFFLGRFKVVQVQLFTVGRELLAVMNVEEKARHRDCGLREQRPLKLGGSSPVPKGMVSQATHVARTPIT